MEVSDSSTVYPHFQNSTVPFFVPTSNEAKFTINAIINDGYPHDTNSCVVLVQ
jgi:hypothetical protein